ncbi:peptidyl prolyl cis-trans isomerase [Grosmannia clavigera kw1407]|uniref:Peptidyl-prolyl cis-trans isomerase n=1 Tax=Grosmannia clavigera (strain kw1407 / UAMH 11150) TaxID=655863 RepID=F0XJ19_GROCL|nr:peptidyl prolyl cis-trans isomerase [Grosmannia clavigera kw1407]EFX02425.1 peptidyl prolyl cis-trans isomerase [Grosmannia clavigera kw1407]
MATAVALDTSMGTVTVELYTDHAPRTCRNFATLAQRGYYDGTIFHRVIPDFMVQGGDPTGTGRGGESIYGKTFADELAATSSPLKHTGAGILSMANAGPNTNGSQFFLTLAPTPWLDGKHTIFGRVRSGLSVLRRMGQVQTGKDDRPSEPLRLVRARVLDEHSDNGGA